MHDLSETILKLPKFTASFTTAYCSGFHQARLRHRRRRQRGHCCQRRRPGSISMRLVPGPFRQPIRRTDSRIQPSRPRTQVLCVFQGICRPLLLTLSLENSRYWPANSMRILQQGLQQTQSSGLPCSLTPQKHSGFCLSILRQGLQNTGAPQQSFPPALGRKTFPVRCVPRTVPSQGLHAQPLSQTQWSKTLLL